jgi:hypothetical protein
MTKSDKMPKRIQQQQQMQEIQVSHVRLNKNPG